MTSSPSVLFLASEADPFVKIGGLGDVAGSLPRALQTQDVNIQLTIPLHSSIPHEQFDLQWLTGFNVEHHNGSIPAEAYTTDLNGLPVYFISGAPFTSDEPVYSDDWEYDAYKYIFFSLAALELTREIGWRPAILHANDWHTAPAVYWLALNRSIDPFFSGTASLLTVHNLPYLGTNGSGPMGAFGLPPARHAPLPDWARHLPLPLGLLTADRITAVSPTYAREILTPEFGSGLEKFLLTRSKDITGILNGLDEDRWDPANDPNLVASYDADTLSLRAGNKIALQRECGFPISEEIPLLSFVGRLNPQKGVDLIPDALDSLIDIPMQIIILGTGMPEHEQTIRNLQKKYPQRVHAVIQYDAVLSHRIYAGADAILIPSRYEPCGLVQMIAMRYGCVPIARATGGLNDTVFEENGDTSNGFIFSNTDSPSLADAIRRAVQLFSDSHRWMELQRQGMLQDFSWDQSARAYKNIYKQLLKARHS